MENTWILYQTTNNVNGKIYVGVHKLQNTSYSKNYVGSGDNIKAAIKKYGRKNFTRTTLAEFSCADDAYLAEAKIVNEDFVKLTNNYNLSLGGRGGANLTTEMKRKIGNANKGRKCTDKAKMQISLALKGRTFSKETREKISAANKGKQPCLGRVISNDTKIKISKSKLGSNNSRSLAVLINDKYYESIRIAARTEKIPFTTLTRRIESDSSKFKNYRFATEEEKQNYIKNLCTQHNPQDTESQA